MEKQIFVVVNVIENDMLWRQIAVGWSWSVIARMEAVEQYGPIADLVRELVQNIDACESAEAAVMIDGELKTVYAVVPRLVCLD
jgi:hypothetical protein